MVAAGRLREANAAIRRIQYEQIRSASLEGMPVDELASYLRARYKTPQDQAYLDQSIPKGNQSNARVRLRAIEKTRAGFNITTAQGRIIKVDRDSKGMVRLNGHLYDESSLRASVESVRKAIDHKYGWLRAFRLIDTAEALIGFDDALMGAFIVTVIITSLTVVYKNGLAPWRASKPSKPIAIRQVAGESLAFQLNVMTYQCQNEKAARMSFRNSLTGRMADEMQKQGIFELDAHNVRARCVETAIASPEEPDIAEACDRMDKYVECLKTYQAATQVIPGAGVKAEPASSSTH